MTHQSIGLDQLAVSIIKYLGAKQIRLIWAEACEIVHLSNPVVV